MTLSGEDLDVHLPAIAAGDADAFARWVAGAEPILRRSLRAFAALVDGEAVVQETLLRAWQAAPRVGRAGRPDGAVGVGLGAPRDPAGGGGARGLRGQVLLLDRVTPTVAARTLAVSEVRRRRVGGAALVELERRSDADVAEWVAPDPLLREHIHRCRQKLPPQPARALAARLEQGGGEPDRSLAERLGMQPNTFLQNVTRARKLLAECLRRAGVDLGPEVA